METKKYRGPYKDLTGRKVGWLKVLRVSHRSASGVFFWLCRCKCGKEKAIRRDKLAKKYTVSCGCYRDSLGRLWGQQRGKRLGCSPAKPDGYMVWMGIKRRCFYAKHPAYARYGGRGITVHPGWLGTGGFKQFMADMGPRPSPKHTIDRHPNPNGNYEPGNVRWAVREQTGPRGVRTRKKPAAGRRDIGRV